MSIERSPSTKSTSDTLAGDEEDKHMLRALIRRTGMPHAELAEFLGIQAGTMAGILSTPGRRPSASAMVVVRHALGVETVEARLARVRRR